MSDLSKVCSRRGDAAAAMVMRATIAELDGHWLELRCAQHGTAMVPFRLIMKRQGGQHRLADMLPRFTCKVCHQPPAHAYLG